MPKATQARHTPKRVGKTVFVVDVGGAGGEEWIRNRLDEVGLDRAADMYEAALVILPDGKSYLECVPEDLRVKTVVIYSPRPDRNEPTRTNDVLQIKNAGFRDVYLEYLNADSLIRWVVTHLNGRMPKD